MTQPEPDTAPVVLVPPLMSQEAVREDPLDAAATRAAEGCDAGLITWRIGLDRVEAAMVFAPEVPLSRAMTMLPLCGVALQNALGTLSPPEVAIHLGWDGTIWVNHGACGQLRARASGRDPAEVPDWLVIGLSLALLPENTETGLTPERTDLFSEGCGDIAPEDLISAWARHSLNWINRWEDEGPRPLHDMWTGLAHGLGTASGPSGRRGVFVGVDEDFGMLLRADSGEMQLIALSSLLEEAT